ncbi:hypothetical protein GCM10028803_07910 [Larkinella knui]|uniref:HEPN AbiU2-like domain-containing protein n=1 Tax=Larkinella knui TaxID=2025310 RepID=A0A3P1CJM5_9BACT|nr:hypothetical protein [Larkinella knui]RRB13541.1 hypothetical protein EHT87_14840 [Larkinella knui]
MTDDRLTEIFLAQKIKQSRKELETDLNNNFDTQEKTLSVIVGGLEHANFNSFTSASVVWNISGYLNLVSYDLKIIGRDLMFAEKDWQRKLYARQAYLLIYESMNDFLQLLGKPLREAVSQFSDAEVCKQRIQAIAKKMNEFKAARENTIKSVRHTAIGHRDKDMLVQLQAIQSIGWLEATQILSQFDAIVRELGAVCQDLMNRTNDDLEIKKASNTN